MGLLTAIPINRLQAICEDYDLPYTPESTVDDLRKLLFHHLLSLSEAVFPSEAVTVPEAVTGLCYRREKTSGYRRETARKIVLNL